MFINKKIILVSSLFLFIVAPFFSLGSGFQATVTPEVHFNSTSLFSLNYDISGSYRFDKHPVVLGAGINAFYADDFFFGLSVFSNYWFINTQVHNTLNFYSAIGVKGDFSTNFKQSYDIKAGIPFTFGLTKLFYDGYLELYGEQSIKPTFVYEIKPLMTAYHFSLAFPVTFGVRFHF